MKMIINFKKIIKNIYIDYILKINFKKMMKIYKLIIYFKIQ